MVYDYICLMAKKEKVILTTHQCFKLARKQKTPAKINKLYHDLMVTNGHLATPESLAKEKEAFKKAKADRLKERDVQNKKDKAQEKKNKKS